MHDGDVIVLDTDKRELSMQVSDEELKRRAQWKAPQPRYTSGVMASTRVRFIRVDGAVTGYEQGGP